MLRLSQFHFDSPTVGVVPCGPARVSFVFLHSFHLAGKDRQDRGSGVCRCREWGMEQLAGSDNTSTDKLQQNVQTRLMENSANRRHWFRRGNGWDRYGITKKDWQKVILSLFILRLYCSSYMLLPLSPYNMSLRTLSNLVTPIAHLNILVSWACHMHQCSDQVLKLSIISWSTLASLAITDPKYLKPFNLLIS